MIYVFEDDERDPLPRLFMKALSSQTASRLVYTRGNGNICKKAEELADRGDTVAVYLDTIPGNDSTRRIYSKLSRLSGKNNNRIIVLPVIGSEYYFIKSIQHESIITSPADIDICVNRKAFFHSQLLSEPEEKKYCKYYERYCKLILKKAVLDCVKNSENKDNKTPNLFFRWYYEKDCRCSKSLAVCHDKSLLRKAEDFVKAYPYFTENRIASNGQMLSEDVIWEKHRKLVDEHNDLCKVLRQAEPDESRRNLYKEIKYIVE